jgi:hypothetical protein
MEQNAILADAKPMQPQADNEPEAKICVSE